MIITFENAIPKTNYILSITMTNKNHMDFDMKPYLETVQFCPLMDKAVWKNIEIRHTCLRWRGNSKVELSIDTLLGLFMAGKEAGHNSIIQDVAAKEDWWLYLLMDNSNSLTMDIGQLLEFPLFAPLSQKKLWKTIKAKEHSLLWKDKNIVLELPIESILNYFA